MPAGDASGFAFHRRSVALYRAAHNEAAIAGRLMPVS